MGSFWRIFKYIWPQWPRIIVIVVSALVIAALLSLSFMTVIPILKVMMGKEGIHGWVDRKTCKWQYGVDFYVPETSDFTTGLGQDMAYSLIVTGVKDKSIAAQAGLLAGDRITGVGNLQISQKTDRILATRLLEELATSKQPEISIQLKRVNQQDVFENMTITLDVLGSKAPGGERQKLNLAQRVAEPAKLALAQQAQRLVKLLPRKETGENKTRAVTFIILVVGLMTVVRCVAKFYQSYLAEKVVQMGVNHLREDVFVHITNMPVGFFINERPSDTISRLVGDTSAMGKAVKIMLGKALREPLNAVFMLMVAMWLNWQLTLVFLCGAPPTLWLVVLLGKKMKRATTKSLVASAQMLSKMQETMAGLKVIKVYNQQEYEHTAFEAINKRILKQLLKISKVDAATMPVMEVLGMAAGSAALVVGAHWVTQNRMDGSEFLVLLMLLGFTAESVRKTSDIWNKIQEANAAADRVFSIVDEPVEPQKANAFELPTITREIEFRNVGFAYPGTDRPVLKNINLTVEAGHNVALVGPNGSGKTTLVNLIPRFYDPSNGQVLIDGYDIREATLTSLRNQIGMVTQNIVTFNDTIAANIAYGRPDASHEEITDAAKRAYAHEFISALPDGYDTVIGEHGTGLSGGQLQRIVIARAILKNPPILIFDEATSQVDADSEAKIKKAIEEIMRNRTTFIIAHRFSTVITADVIVVMDDGRIVAKGKHEQLMHSCHLYSNLYETQLIKA